jgi:hypothetical protein
MTGGPLPFLPAKTAGQSTEKICSFLTGLRNENDGRLTYVTVLSFVCSDCGPRLRPQDSVDGAVVITGA